MKEIKTGQLDHFFTYQIDRDFKIITIRTNNYNIGEGVWGAKGIHTLAAGEM